MGLTLLDIAKKNGADKTVNLIEGNFVYAPEVSVIPARTIRGTSYKTVTRTALPATEFRNAGEGYTVGSSAYKTDLVEAFLFGGRLEIDKATAMASEDGVEQVLTDEAMGMGKSVLQELGKQIFYGVSEDAKGFAGLKSVSTYGGTTASGNAMTINAGGSTADTASSVYMVAFGPQDVQLVVGQGGSMEMPEFRLGTITGTNSKSMDGYISQLDIWIGMQVGNDECVKRIANLTADSGKGLTDALLSQLLAQFPVGKRPSAIFMARRSLDQLTRSRSVTLFGNGTSRPNQEIIAPTPTSFEGIPIIVTDSILKTDAIES